jgi:hypothetical protein
MSIISDQIKMKIHAAAYEEAYLLGQKALELNSCDRDEIKSAMCDLTARLRSSCMDLASLKRDAGPNYQLLEDLLGKTNKLTGQDMYGRFI